MSTTAATNIEVVVGPVIAVQNCGNAGLNAIKTLVAKGGCSVRTASRDPEKLKSTKLKGLDVDVFQTGDEAFFAGVNRFIAIAPGTKDPDDRAKLAIEFAQKCKDGGATHGSMISLVVAAAANRRGLFGAQFGAVEDAITAMDGVTVCIIRAPFFLDNMWGDVATITSHDTFYAPVAGNVKQLVAAVSDIGEALAVGALDDSHAGKAYFVLGDYISKSVVAELYSQKLGRIINHVQASVEAATEALKGFGFLQWQIDGILELNELNDSAEFMAQHSGEFKELTDRDPLTTSQFMDAALVPALIPDTSTHSRPVLLVMGYGTNVGGGTVEAYASQGYDVAIVSRTQSKLDAASAKYAERGMKVVGFAGDLAQPSTIAALVNKVEAELGPISHCLYNATIGAPRHVDPYEKHSAFYANTEDIVAASNLHINSMHVTLNALLVRWKVRGRGTFLLSGGGFCFDGAKAVNWSPTIPSWEIGGSVKAYWKCFAEAANVTLEPLGIRVGCLIIERIIGMDWNHGVPEAYVLTPKAVGDAFYAFAHRSSWTPTEIWPPREAAPPAEAVSSEANEEFAGETKQEPIQTRKPTMSSNETAAKSCKIISHTDSKHISYTIMVEEVHEPFWKLKKTPVQRGFHDFQKLHHVIAKQAKANKLTPPRTCRTTVEP